MYLFTTECRVLFTSHVLVSGYCRISAHDLQCLCRVYVCHMTKDTASTLCANTPRNTATAYKISTNTSLRHFHNLCANAFLCYTRPGKFNQF
jgi:hypothetical protein